MVGDKRELHKRICTHLLVWATGLALLVFVFPKVLGFFMPLLVAWVIALIANPMVHFLEDRIKIMRKHGSFIVIVFVIAVVVAILYLIVWLIVSQASSLVGELPTLYETMTGNLQDSLSNLHQKYHIIPENLQSVIDTNDNKINDYILALLNSLQESPISAVGSVASSLIDWFVLLILTVMMSYFFVADREKLHEFIVTHTPDMLKKSVSIIWNTVVRALGGYLKACFMIMGVMFVILWIFFISLGVSHSLLIALITAVLDFLPFIGTGTVLMPWAVYSIITGEYVKAAVLVAAYFVTLLTRRLLEPKLVGDSIGMSPFLTLLSMFIGYRLIGMLGLIVGIPAAMILQVFYENGLFDRTIRGIRILAEDISEYQKY